MRFQYPVSFLAGKYDKEKFYEMAKGMEHLKEGGARCMKCYELRLEEAAQQAAEGRFDYFTTAAHDALISFNLGLKWGRCRMRKAFFFILRRL